MGYASFDLFRPSYGREYLWRCAVGHILRGRPSFPVGWRALRATGVRPGRLSLPADDGWRRPWGARSGHRVPYGGLFLSLLLLVLVVVVVEGWRYGLPH